MPKYVALLRGIAPMNPNMQNTKLRAVCEELGFTDVVSVIASGNIIFTSPLRDTAKIEEKLEAAWPQKLGFSSTSMVRSLKELQALRADDPFPGLTHSRETYLNVTFLKREPPKGAAIASAEGYDVVCIRPREVCTVVDVSRGNTPDFMVKAERAYGKEITTRTWKTVERILKIMEA
jgi:uncharacterized protein (DUF1697 family)